MRQPLPAALLVVAIGVAGCDWGDDGESAVDDAERAEVREVAERFVTAYERDDTRTICRELLAPSALAELRVGIRRCERSLPTDSAPPDAGELDFSALSIDDDSAAVPMENYDDHLPLVREAGRWYVLPGDG